MSPIDELEQIALQIDPARLQGTPKRDATLNMRISDIDKASIATAAGRYGLSVTEYVLRIHYEIERVTRPATPNAQQPATKPVKQSGPRLVTQNAKTGKRSRRMSAADQLLPGPRRQRAQDAYIAELDSGKGVSEACAALGLHRTTPTDWRKDPAFAQREAAARGQA